MNKSYSAASGQGIYAGRFNTTPLQTFIAAMPSNSWAEYTGTNINEMQTTRFDGEPTGILETTANYPLTNWANKFAWDDESKVLSLVGTAQGYISNPQGDLYSKHVIFDLFSNSFTTQWNPTGQRQGHIYDANCSGFVGELTYRKAYNDSQLWQYNKASATWSVSYTLAGLSTISAIWALECNAVHNALYCLEQLTGRLVKFDLATGARSVIGTHTGVGAYPVITSVGDHVIFGAGDTSTKLYKIDASGVVTLVSDALPVPYDCRGNYRVLPHPTDTNKALLFSQSDSKIRSLNIVTGLFSDIGTIPSEPLMLASASSSLVGMAAVVTWRGAARLGGTTQSKFWIYKV